MINQVIIAGRLIEDPQADGRGCALRLELARPARGSSGGEEAPATVRAVASDERRAANLQRYLRKGRDVLIHGHLQQDAGGLCVAVDSFEFMEDGLRTHLVVGAPTAEQAMWRRGGVEDLVVRRTHDLQLDGSRAGAGDGDAPVQDQDLPRDARPTGATRLARPPPTPDPGRAGVACTGPPGR
jgi:hypothetical protein